MIKLEFEQNLSRDDVIIISRDGRKWFVISGSSRLMEERHLNPMPSEDKKPFGMILESAALSWPIINQQIITWLHFSKKYQKHGKITWYWFEIVPRELPLKS